MESLIASCIALGDVDQLLGLLGKPTEESKEESIDLAALLGPNKTTLLHLAAAKGNLRATKTLLAKLDSYDAKVSRC